MKRIPAKSKLLLLAASLGVAISPLSAAGDSMTARATLKSPEGKTLGEVTLTEASKGVLVKADLKGLAPGRHALHIHEKGACEAPDFKSAGGHFNPTGAAHGYLSAKGPHAGDMMNFDTPESGEVVVENVAPMVTLTGTGKRSVFHPGGTAIVIHSGTDDYKSQPSGDAGSRIACGVIER